MMPTRVACAATLALALAALACASAAPTPIEQMVQSAESPGDHWRLVEYYREAAADARRQGAEHRRLAEVYSSRLSWGMAFAARAREHCEELAAFEERRAAHLDRLAAEHERMAQQ